jgi:hypothetical protein
MPGIDKFTGFLTTLFHRAGWASQRRPAKFWDPSRTEFGAPYLINYSEFRYSLLLPLKLKSLQFKTQPMAEKILYKYFYK